MVWPLSRTPWRWTPWRWARKPLALVCRWLSSVLTVSVAPTGTASLCRRRARQRAGQSIACTLGELLDAPRSLSAWFGARTDP